MRLLVIGAAGFLGAHIRSQAEAAGLEVETAGRSLLPASPAHTLVDLARDGPGTLTEMLAGIAPDAVINCVGAISGPVDVLAATNITGAYALVQAMQAKSHGRLVHLGSAAEYGRVAPGVPVDEQTPPRPVGVYGATKLAGTRLVELARSTGLDAVVLRVFNPVGPGAPDASLPGRLVAELRTAMAEGAEVRLGPLDAVRDFVDARDVADAAIAAAIAPALPHPVLNIGSGRGSPVRALVTELTTISGYTGPVHEDAEGSARSGDVAWQQADINLAGTDLDWQPSRTLATSLADLWKANA